jgi:hypothetical protein
LYGPIKLLHQARLSYIPLVVVALSFPVLFIEPEAVNEMLQGRTLSLLAQDFKLLFAVFEEVAIYLNVEVFELLRIPSLLDKDAWGQHGRGKHLLISN